MVAEGCALLRGKSAMEAEEADSSTEAAATTLAAEGEVHPTGAEAVSEVVVATVGTRVDATTENRETSTPGGLG
jgi:hypothetical protein